MGWAWRWEECLTVTSEGDEMDDGPAHGVQRTLASDQGASVIVLLSSQASAVVVATEVGLPRQRRKEGR